MIQLADDLPAILAMMAAAVGVDSGSYHVPGAQEVIGMWAVHLASSLTTSAMSASVLHRPKQASLACRTDGSFGPLLT